MKKIFLTALYVVTACSWIEAGQFKATTYYPAPSGVYDRLRFSPRATLPAGDCNAGTVGTIYYDTTSQRLVSCVPNGGSQEWNSLPGVWKQMGENITLGDTANPSLKKVAIGTQTPEMMLTLDADGGILAKGALGAGTTLTTSGWGTRFLWYPKKAAIRAGYVNSSQWDETNIHNYTVAFGSNNLPNGTYSTISGGTDNTTYSWCQGYYCSDGRGYATIGGGQSNVAPVFSTVAGGRFNYAGTVFSNDNFIGGGTSNVMTDKNPGGAAVWYGVIGGGWDNKIIWQEASTIGGGKHNSIEGNSVTIGGGESNSVSTSAAGIIGGGSGNKIINSSYTTIAGGQANEIYTDRSTIGGGLGNTIKTMTDATIGGGQGNTTSGDSATIAGGKNNTTNVEDSVPTPGGDYAAIGGGFANRASGRYAVVGGGNGSTASGEGATISGGGRYLVPAGPPYSTNIPNTASGNFSTISGGRGNTVTGDDATIGGGISNTASGQYSAILGGFGNHATGNYSVIGGGGASAAEGNQANGTYGFIGNGYYNIINGNYSVIGGGFSNRAPGNYAFVGGGGYESNHPSWGRLDPTAGADYSVVVGGQGNRAFGLHSSILGGYANTISAGAQYSAIANGNNNLIGPLGTNAFVANGSNYAGGPSSVAMGKSVSVDSDYSFAYGNGVTLQNTADNTVAFGYSSLPAPAITTANAFVIYNGNLSASGYAKVGVGVVNPS
ncbi:MAG: hypothetical protein U1D99_02410, partial [Candidatus Omnitrophota bacterium]|nr:hypothetical protein [Candidatus Omnitrophota bacterium]